MALINTALNTEIAKGDFQAVKHLIENQGYSANYTGLLGLAHTPLYTAVASKQGEILNYLIQKGADVNASGRWGFDDKPMDLALVDKHLPTVASLVFANAELPYGDYTKTKFVTECLVKAASVNDIDSIKNILQNPYADINHYYFPDNSIERMSPLVTAVKENHLEATTLLIEKGATIKPFSRFNWKDHPLNLVKDLQVAQLVIEHTPEVNNALLMFTVLGKTELIPLLLKHGALINDAYFDMAHGFITPLEAAIRKDDSTMIKCLVSNGADLALESTNINHSFATPLEYAAIHGKLQALEALIELGADLSHKNALSGKTALELAIKAGYTDAMNILTLDKGELSSETTAKSEELNSIEMDEVLTLEQILTPIVDEPYSLKDSSNATVSNNIQSVEDDIQPTNGTLLISIELNEVLCDEQMIMPAEQAVQSILQADNSTVSDLKQTEMLYVQPVESILVMMESEQVFGG